MLIHYNLLMAKNKYLSLIQKESYKLGFLFTGFSLNFPPYRRWICNQFHKLVYGSFVLQRPWTMTKWLGIPILKCPFDLWVYQELIFDLKPDVLIESGSHLGGGAFYFASICDLLGKGRVISIDLENQKDRATHPRITYLQGSSIDPIILDHVQNLIREDEKVMVWLDSAHEKEHVLAEMYAYAPMVSKDYYLVVEDTNLNGNPVWLGYGAGPAEAVATFLTRNNEFIVDKDCEKYYLTFNPGGFLKRVVEES